MKFLIAAATAGALVAGSAPGAMAAPPMTKPPKKTTAPVLKSVDIKRHSAINFYNVNPAANSPIKVTARFKDPSGKGLTASSTVAVTLAEYSQKVGGTRAVMPTVSPVTVDLKWTRGKKSKLFTGVVNSDQLKMVSDELKANEGTSILLCLSSISPETALSTKMKKRLDNGKGVVAVGDCVRLVYKAPSPTPADPTTPPADSTTPPTVTPPGAGSPTTTSPTTTSPTTSVPGADSTTTPPAGSATPTTTPGKSAVALVKAIDRGNKLYVNVNPNKGKGYWRFQVQRKKGVDTWKTLSTYRTKGTKETRKLDLKKGTYRVVVLAKYGHQGATSAEVSLKR